MDDELKAFVWQICQYLQADFLTKLPNDELTTLFQQVFSLSMLMKHIDTEPVEKQVVEECVNKLITEIRRRNIRVRSMPIEVIIASDGTFVKGEEELRYAFEKLDFDEMMDFIDSILKHPLNDAQRTALINVARDKIYADADADANAN